PVATVAPAAAPAPAPPPEPQPVPVGVSPSRRSPARPNWAHAVPAALLALALLIVVIVDLAGGGSQPDAEPGGPPPTQEGVEALRTEIENSKPTLGVEFNEQARFGLTLLFQADPGNEKEKKKLTFAKDGSTNNTIVRIDNYDYYFGKVITGRNTWVTKPPLKE